jgi:pantoate--beta-alanine ligase
MSTVLKRIPVEPVAVARTPKALRDWIVRWRREGRRIALVPTMGALHEGHVTLIRAAAAAADRVVVSIFVNPTQFGPGEDFDAYPRREAADLDILSGLGVALAYVPPREAMYADGFMTRVTVDGSLTAGLEAAIRPGHFAGVATIVVKLLLQAMPDVAVFGEKDYQQLRIVSRVVRDLDVPVEILPVPTVRDSAGLALSSRNAYLSSAELEVARRLNQVLASAGARLRAGAEAVTACAEAVDALKAAGFTSVDYVALGDAETLEPLGRLDRPARLLAAAKLGRTRLIDNLAVYPGDMGSGA